jgi:chromosome segregation ATPase
VHEAETRARDAEAKASAETRSSIATAARLRSTILKLRMELASICNNWSLSKTTSPDDCLMDESSKDESARDDSLMYIHDIKHFLSSSSTSKETTKSRDKLIEEAELMKKETGITIATLTAQLETSNIQHERLEHDRHLVAKGLHTLNERLKNLEHNQKHMEKHPDRVACRWSDYQILKTQLEDSIRFSNTLVTKLEVQGKDNLELTVKPAVELTVQSTVNPPVNPILNPITTLLSHSSTKPSYSPLEGLSSELVYRFALDVLRSCQCSTAT